MPETRRKTEKLIPNAEASIGVSKILTLVQGTAVVLKVKTKRWFYE